ncbi:hypothetical protein KDAU_31770 [Dictyobacter aurantiacus]|uniref:Uncharacterized protein n=1 Tax=Dictyobacter aurantiacus TaxID=1936993 RepID=A0A401ZGN5_9CHLR|nr:hypothetical protein KDAU_31770 [Dictyobacter aurantiacus]
MNSTVHSVQRLLMYGRKDIPTTVTTTTTAATAVATVAATAAATVVATSTPMSYDEVNQTVDVGNGPQVPSNQGQPINGAQDPQSSANFDGIDNNDESKVINVDDNTKIVLDQGSSVVVINSDENCDNDHNDHHHNDHHHHHHNNNRSSGHVFAAGGVVAGAVAPRGGYPAMPFTGGDPRPQASK